MGALNFWKFPLQRITKLKYQKARYRHRRNPMSHSRGHVTRCVTVLMDFPGFQDKALPMWVFTIDICRVETHKFLLGSGHCCGWLYTRTICCNCSNFAVSFGILFLAHRGIKVEYRGTCIWSTAKLSGSRGDKSQYRGII